MARYARDRVEHILVKPHPRESKDYAVQRAAALRRAARPAMVSVAPASLAVEVLYLALRKVDLVLGAFSTSLATAVVLVPGAKVVAPLDGPGSGSGRGYGYHSAYRLALSRMGVEFLDLSAGTRG
jgi:hypothetical protein